MLPEELINTIKTPLEAFSKKISNELFNMITIQANIYANQHKGLYPPVTNKEVIIVLSFLLLSGYCKAPWRELDWSTSFDTHNESVSKSITRNRFRAHFNNNVHIPDNSWYWKWPILQNSIFIWNSECKF